MHRYWNPALGAAANPPCSRRFGFVHFVPYLAHLTHGAVGHTERQLGFKDLEEITTPFMDSQSQHAWHLYVIQINTNLLKITRNEFMKKLFSRNIGASVHFIPLHLHPYYRNNFCFNGEFPNAEHAYERVISLPLYPALKEDDVFYVIKTVREIIIENRKSYR